MKNCRQRNYSLHLCKGEALTNSINVANKKVISQITLGPCSLTCMSCHSNKDVFDGNVSAQILFTEMYITREADELTYTSGPTIRAKTGGKSFYVQGHGVKRLKSVACVKLVA